MISNWRKNSKPKEDKILIMPDNFHKINWDFFMAGLLVYSCLLTTVQLALFDNLSTHWKVINYVIDFLFAVDIAIIFNSAFFDDDAQIIKDRSQIV